MRARRDESDAENERCQGRRRWRDWRAGGRGTEDGGRQEKAGHGDHRRGATRVRNRAFRAGASHDRNPIGAAVVARGAKMSRRRRRCRRTGVCRRGCGRNAVMRMTRHHGRRRCWRRLPRCSVMFMGHGRHRRGLEAQRHARRQQHRRSGQCDDHRDTGQPLGPGQHVPSIRPKRLAAFSVSRPTSLRPEHYRSCRRRRSALPMTDTELNVIAALAMMGLSRSPNAGYSTPAATGTPSTL